MKILSFRALLAICLLASTAGATHAGSYSTAVLASNPTAYFQMGEHPVVLGTALDDSSPNGKDGAWGYPPSSAAVPSNTVPTSGIVGPSGANGWGGLDAGNVGASFAGNGAPDGGPADLLNLPNDGTFNNADATVAFFMSTTFSGNDSRLFTTGTAANANSFKVVYGTSDFTGTIGNDFGAIAVDTNDFSPKQIRSSVFNFSSGAWVHIAVVRNGGTAANAKFYINGVDYSASLSAVGDSYGTTDPSPHIGARHGNTDPGNGAYRGDLDEFAYWNRALSAAEIGALYQAATVPEPAAGLIASLGAVAVVHVRRRGNRRTQV